MKQRLIDRWLDLYTTIRVFPRTCRDRPNISKEKERIEDILWLRYGYDVALTKTSINK